VPSKVSLRPPLGYIEIRVFSHATEDQEKVQTAVRNTLPEELITNMLFSKTSLTGHHGNPILLLEAKLVDKQALPLVLKRIGNGLPPLDKAHLSEQMGLHVDRSNLYLRFDKQQAFVGQLRLGLQDAIHFKLHFKSKSAGQIESLCKENGLLP
jgi:hypothetical protein